MPLMALFGSSRRSSYGMAIGMQEGVRMWCQSWS